MSDFSDKVITLTGGNFMRLVSRQVVFLNSINVY